MPGSAIVSRPMLVGVGLLGCCWVLDVWDCMREIGFPCVVVVVVGGAAGGFVLLRLEDRKRLILLRPGAGVPASYSGLKQAR